MSIAKNSVLAAVLAAALMIPGGTAFSKEPGSVPWNSDVKRASTMICDDGNTTIQHYPDVAIEPRQDGIILQVHEWGVFYILLEAGEHASKETWFVKDAPGAFSEVSDYAELRKQSRAHNWGLGCTIDE